MVATSSYIMALHSPKQVVLSIDVKSTQTNGPSSWDSSLVTLLKAGRDRVPICSRVGMLKVLPLVILNNF